MILETVYVKESGEWRWDMKFTFWSKFLAQNQSIVCYRLVLYLKLSLCAHEPWLADFLCSLSSFAIIKLLYYLSLWFMKKWEDNNCILSLSKDTLT